MPSEPLGWKERATALGVGIASGGGGAYAVFASSNQAGTAILLVLSAIFLLIGIQGTSLIRFSTGSNTVEPERRRRTVEQAVKNIAKEEPERAAGIIEGAELALPALGSISASAQMALMAAQYELKLSAAISSMGYTVSGATRPDYGLDLLVADQENRTVGVTATYRRNTILPRRWLERSAQPLAGTMPLLLVTNAPVPPSTREWAAQMPPDAPIRLTQWRDEFDNQTLRDTLAELFGSIPPK